MSLFFHMISQFEWDQFKDLLYILAPLLILAAVAAAGFIAPLAGLALEALFGGTSAAAQSLIISAVGITELEVLAGSIASAAAMSETLNRTLEVGQRRSMGPPVSDLVQSTDPPLNTYIQPPGAHLPNDISWIPDVDWTHPKWRNLSHKELADLFGITEEQLMSFK